MAILLNCRCRNAFEVPNSFAGNSAMCPECGTFLDIPEDDERVEFVEGKELAEVVLREEREPRDLKHKVRDAFESDIRPVKRTSGYRFAVTCVAIAMLALPAMYVGLILLIVVLLFLHITMNYTLFREVRFFWALVMYVGPIVVGFMLLAFMVKPLLARPPRARRGRSIRLEKEPILASFVDDIAWAVHAPRPNRIEVDCQVNASAGFGVGLTSMFGQNLTLTIGLPLVLGLSARQFAGVLAHEFGHFSQGAGMRVSYVVRTINAWFYRIVYERDSWDEDLREWCKEEGLASYIATAIRGCVAASRGILWVFMMMGHVLSCFLLRRMEFDADRSEVRLVGTRTFEKTFKRFAVLQGAAEEASEIVEGCWIKDRFPDNFAALVVALADEMPVRERRRILEEMEEARTGVFDTHPSFADRLASANQEDPKGVFDLDLPAAALFRQLPKLTEAASLDHYKGMFGRGIRVTLKPVSEYLSRRR
jgi:Zn-dependent protease with chaperone function